MEGDLREVMVSNLDYQTVNSEFESHCMPDTSGLVLELSNA